MAKREDTLSAHLLEEVITVLLCLVDDADFNIHPKAVSMRPSRNSPIRR